MSLFDKLADALSGKADPREGAEELNKALPETVSGRPAVLKRRKYYREADQATESDEARATRLKVEALKGTEQ